VNLVLGVFFQWLSLLVLVASTIIVGYGNFLGSPSAGH
jgi:hypothetical protein